MLIPERVASPAARLCAEASRVTGWILLGAVLALMQSTDALAHARDRFRCIPADGSESYTSPGSCHSDTDKREPLTEQEMADALAAERRGLPFYRCTAADGSYSTVIRSGECPSDTDTRTTEYAQQAIPSVRQAASQPASSPAAQSEPVRLEVPAVQQAATATSASAAPVPDAGQVRTGPGLFGKLGLMVLVVLGFFAAFEWLGRRHGQSKIVAQQARRNTSDTQRSNPATTAPQALSQPMKTGVDLNQQARVFLTALDEGADLPGGLDFRKALQQSRLDYTLESLDRVERLLKQIRLRYSPQRENWKSRPSAGNFCLMLAFYMGTVISRQTKIPIQWCSREQAASFMPADMPIPEADWSRVVGIIGTSACVPLGLIEDKLFDEPGDMTCRGYVERLVARLPEASPADENQRCETMLEAFFADRDIKGGLKFREQLKLIQPDYSAPSLERLDQLLRSIRARLAPQYEEFVNNADTQNFLRLVAFYIGMTVARTGNMSVKWLDFQQAREGIPDLEFAFETTSVCVLNGRVYLPLGLVTEILLQPAPQRTVAEWAREALRFASAPTPSILRNSLLSNPAIPLDGQIAFAVKKAGFMAAWSMYAVEGGGTGAPTVFVPGEGDTGTFKDFSFYGTQEEAFAATDGQMSGNPHNVPFQIMSFDGYANLHTGRTDALTIDLRIYPGKWPAAKEGLSMTVACPYRHADNPRGFAIFSPKLLECSAPTAWNDSIFKNF
ncbi:hypothetical protein [Niveibacterium terrae]|uniref:hypothetical protein n=1 Tax=Niveibacterium terrae TaxID=3373598 RepID=UPI003A8EB436